MQNCDAEKRNVDEGNDRERLRRELKGVTKVGKKRKRGRFEERGWKTGLYRGEETNIRKRIGPKIRTKYD